MEKPEYYCHKNLLFSFAPNQHPRNYWLDEKARVVFPGAINDKGTKLSLRRVQHSTIYFQTLLPWRQPYKNTWLYAGIEPIKSVMCPFLASRMGQCRGRVNLLCNFFIEPGPGFEPWIWIFFASEKWNSLCYWVIINSARTVYSGLKMLIELI